MYPPFSKSSKFLGDWETIIDWLFDLDVLGRKKKRWRKKLIFALK